MGLTIRFANEQTFYQGLLMRDYRISNGTYKDRTSV